MTITYIGETIIIYSNRLIGQYYSLPSFLKDGQNKKK